MVYTQLLNWHIELMPVLPRNITGLMPTADLLHYMETCARKGWFSRSWQRHLMLPNDMLYAAIHTGLTSARTDFGEAAGEEVMALGEHRGLEDDGSHRVYDRVVSLAAMADLITTAIRKPTEPPWGLPEPRTLGEWTWEPSCYLVGESLRRIALVSHWTDARHYAECRSWRTLGEQSIYEKPMQMAVVVLGQTKNGKRVGPWSKCFQHPMNKAIRFRKKSRSTTEAFKSTWQEIWRVDHAEITNQAWLQAMLTDDVLNEVLFSVDIPLPDHPHRLRIRQTTERKLSALHAMKEKPDIQYSTCDFPVPCVFKRCCHVFPEREPGEKNGFVRLSNVLTSTAT